MGPLAVGSGGVSPRPKLHQRVLERVTLAAASVLSRSLDGPRRNRLRRATDRVRDCIEASEALWADGFRAEAVRVASEGLVASSAARQTANDLLGPASTMTLALRGGTGRDELEALERGTASPLPASNADVGLALEAWYWTALSAARSVHRALAPITRTARQLRWTQIRRAAVAFVVLISAVVFPWLPAIELPRVRVRASSQWSTRAHLPEEAVDGNPLTEWHARDGQSGWLEINLSPPRDIARLRVLNGHNGRYEDRAIGSAIFTLYRRGTRVGRVDHEWAEIEAQPAWVELPVQAQDVDRIRVTIRRHLGLGTALAELAWD